MVQIQSTDAINAIRNGAKLTVSEGFPQNLDTTRIQAVMDMTPDFHRTAKVLGQGTGSMFTADAVKRTFVTGLLMSYTKTAADTGAYMRVAMTMGGAQTIIAFIGSITATADARTVFIPFNVPMEIDKGGTCAITISGTYTDRYAMAYGYEVD